MTLGERVEDVFLIDGAALNNARGCRSSWKPTCWMR
jgi:UTP:GlnB (protein PII) uridylyltransferase